MIRPRYVVVGHVARDRMPHGWTFGGTAFYSALTAQALGACVTSVTRLRSTDAELLSQRYPKVDWQVRPASRTTTFTNRLTPAGRTQHMSVPAPAVVAADLARTVGDATVVHLAPIAGEISPRILDALPTKALVGITGQGMLRSRRANGAIAWKSWRSHRRYLARADVLVLSDEDIRGDPKAGRRYLEAARLGVLTRGALPLLVFESGVTREFPTVPARERDPLAAGDVFAAALFMGLARRWVVDKSLRYATAAAAIWIERAESRAFPTDANVRRRIAT